MRSRWYLAVLVLVPAVAALVAAKPQLATARDRDDLGREDVRHAVETGEIRSLADIIAAVRGKLPGEVAGVEIERKNGHWRYEFRVVDSQGRLFEVYIDARNGEIQRIKEK